MSDGKIYIVITDKRQSNAAGGVNVDEIQAGGTDSKGKESALEKYAFHRFANFLEAQAKQAVSYTINNIGNFTGDYVTQRNVHGVMKAVSHIVNVASAAIAGAKIGGAPGAIIAASIATADIFISNAYEQNSARVEQNKNAHQIELLRQRSGLNSLLDGNRGTEN